MTLFDSIVRKARSLAPTLEENIIHDVMQAITLSGLSRVGFFRRAAICGETSLRHIHGLRRYTDSLELAMLDHASYSRMDACFSAIKEEFMMAGKEIKIQMSTDSEGGIFLMDGLETKAKIDLYIENGAGINTEMMTIASPRMAWVRAYDLPGLFAGKVSAALFRKWKTRVKGRDWYDLVWYISHNTPLDMTHLIERAKESGEDVDVSTYDKLIAVFDAKIDAIDFENAKGDVLPYLTDRNEVAYWSKDFFHQLVRKIKCDKENDRSVL